MMEVKSNKLKIGCEYKVRCGRSIVMQRICDDGFLVGSNGYYYDLNSNQGHLVYPEEASDHPHDIIASL